ncbi:MAG: SDR family oxidoreductase [Pseudomonadota bacterium]
MNILITGASSGFGSMMAADLVKAGHKVVGTVRDPEGRNAEAAKALRDIGAEIVEIDVTSDTSVEAGVAEAAAKLGSIDVLVNNAGNGAHGLQENFSAADFQKLFDINVFGVQRMTRAVLPDMRSRQSGLILNVSSLLGRIVIPFYGPYNASKWALEAMTENYRVELSGFGVDVALVEPGGFPTDFASRLLNPSSRDRDAGYGPMAEAPAQSLAAFNEFFDANPQQDPQLVSDAVVQLIATPAGQRPFRTEVDKVGMGDLIKPMNDQLAEATLGLFTNFGMADMLKLNTKEAA